MENAKKLASPFKARLTIFMKSVGMGQTKFEEETGLSRGSINKIVDSMKDPSINKIKARFPELNISWLKTGSGEMLEGKEVIKNVDVQDVVIGFILNEIAEIKSSMKGTFYSDEKEALLSRIAQIDKMK